jgi:hypothetical protein
MWPRELVVAQTQAIHQLHASPKKATTEGLWGTQTRLVEAVTVCANPCVCSPCTATRCSLRMCFWHWPAWACSLFWICHVFLAPRRCKASLDPSDQAVPWLLNLELTRACASLQEQTVCALLTKVFTSAVFYLCKNNFAQRPKGSTGCFELSSHREADS